MSINIKYNKHGVRRKKIEKRSILKMGTIYEQTVKKLDEFLVNLGLHQTGSKIEKKYLFWKDLS